MKKIIFRACFLRCFVGAVFKSRHGGLFVITTDLHKDTQNDKTSKDKLNETCTA